jgi:ADP-ribose pyrophosphatase
VVYEGPLFRVQHDKIVEPGGRQNERDVIRHNGSVVILAIDNSKSKRDPWIVMERQYRHAANQYLWELPAGKSMPARSRWRRKARTGRGDRLPGEEMASVGRVLRQPRVSWRVDEGVSRRRALQPGETHPEDDEEIELRLVKPL